MKKMLSFLCVASLLLMSTSCSKESIKPENKSNATNAKSQGSSGTTAPSTPSSDHQGGCPNHSSYAG